MSYQSIMYDVEDRIGTITLNRPERMNTFGDTLLADWADALRGAQDDPDVRVVVVTGAGRAFCAGADLKAGGEAGDVLRQELNAGERRNSLRYNRAPRRARPRIPRQAVHRRHQRRGRGCGHGHGIDGRHPHRQRWCAFRHVVR